MSIKNLSKLKKLEAVKRYLFDLNKTFESGICTEHSYRADLQNLIKNLNPCITAINEAKRQKYGAPDFVINKNNLPIGYLETKDIGDTDLEGIKSNKEQFDRYKNSLENTIFTDYVSFLQFRGNKKVLEIDIGELNQGKIIPKTENFDKFLILFDEFFQFSGISIKSPKELAIRMAGKAILLKNIIFNLLSDEENNKSNIDLYHQYKAIKKILIKDLNIKEFSDLYSQTLAYGLFAARLQDPTLTSFSRQEAAELIPKSNPLLRQLFGYIAGPNIDESIKWVVDDLVDLFRATDIKLFFEDDKNINSKEEDPVIHFYETFLKEFDPKTKNRRGVVYTPYPAVNFIVKSIDSILLNDFNLPEGLATNQLNIVENKTKNSYKEFQKVQILDPATGTGTFLTQTIKIIHSKLKGQYGAWNSYVNKNLIPRINGFELLMASYSIAHLKTFLLLQNLGFNNPNHERFKIFLTNSLEEPNTYVEENFVSWLVSEAKEANRIKKDTPIMCIMGNPPYFAKSSNKGEWITKLVKDYFHEPNSNKKLDEKNSKQINDDYVKFIRLSEHLINKNGEGLIGFITNNGFLNNPTFRGMRWHLMESFDKIIILDLHGNSNKKEKCPDGSIDQNIFNIKLGVCITFFIKKKNSNKEECLILHKDLYGTEAYKNNFLNDASFPEISFNKLVPQKPFYNFIPENYKKLKDYNCGFSLSLLFKNINVGYATGKDKLLISDNKFDLEKNIKDYLENSNKSFDRKFIKKSAFRPFDNKYIYFDPNLLVRPRKAFIDKIEGEGNIILLLGKSTGQVNVSHFFVSNIFSEIKCAERTKCSYMFPLYQYDSIGGQLLLDNNLNKKINLKKEIIDDFSKTIETPYKEFSNEKSFFSEKDLINYIYAVLYSKKYRESFSDFLKNDFPKIPFPKSKTNFLELSNIGERLINIHLLKDIGINNLITSFPIEGTNFVEKFSLVGKKLFINESQFFEGVNENFIEFEVGGYQPLKKWLKDRTNTNLNFDSIMHYQKIISAINLTLQIIEKIDLIGVNNT